MSFDIILSSLVKSIITMLKMFSFLLIPIITIFLIFLIMNFYFYIKHRFIEKIIPIKSDYVRQKKRNFFQTIFLDFPKQLTYDFLTTDPNEFKEYGIRVVVGEQGSGKTMTAVYLLQQWQKRYQKSLVYTNMNYKFENGSLDHWKQLIERNNGKFGVINVIDEIKAWFSNKESKDVPPEILTEICQQRKQRKLILGTVQVFSELAKPFRSQTHLVYVPKTILGCLTIVRISKAKWYDAELDEYKKYCGFFIFAHNKKLRNAYDTYQKIAKYKDYEFASGSSIVATESNSQTCE